MQSVNVMPRMQKFYPLSAIQLVIVIVVKEPLEWRVTSVALDT